MFASSSQRVNWIFSDEEEISKLKQDINHDYIERHGSGMTDHHKNEHFISVAEQDMLVRHNELAMKAFCKSFNPPMPLNVMATAMVYLKRIYLRYSAMDYHPRDIITTCVYLACKVDEFNISLRHFVGNLKKDREKASDQILWFELTLMQILNFQLTIHTAYRPLEGLIIHLKTHMPDVDVESLRPGATTFLDTALFTNAYLIYAPSQIALAALLQSATDSGLNINYFVAEHLMRGATPEQVTVTLNKTQEIILMVSKASKPSKSEVKLIDKKLEKCRNQELNPNSEIFQRRVKELDEDDDQQQLQLYQQNTQDQLRMEREIITD